jgi:hypothetical protein
VSDDPCAPIHEILARLRRDYEKACEPWLKMLADYAAARPPAPFIVPADQPSGVVLRNGDTMEFVSTNTEAGLTISDVKVTRAADQQEVQYCECAAPVPREPAGSSLPWCNTCGFDIQPDKT